MEDAIQQKYTLRRDDLLYPELSFKIVGILFEVYKELGPGHQEKYYQKAVAIGLRKEKIKFREQVYVPLKYHGENVGKYFLDFLIEDKIILELKKGEFIPASTFNQVKGYLEALDLKLSIVANFTSKGVLYKRIALTKQQTLSRISR